ncbi:MAG TPA: Holliday junction branch migration protein RuvA [Kofleriaceae bacterium]|nr:Holliday junction branch migration protein RuvA [Kofleriaceae bacterium]
MIGHLRGTLLERSGAAVIVDCGGVGYEVMLSGHSQRDVGSVGDEVSLRVFTHAQENRIALYGFTSAEERQLFDHLITVKNVGPASAMKILSAGANPADIARLIAGGQTSALQALRGVGKKTAELLVVELRDACEDLLRGWGEVGVSGGAVVAIGARRAAAAPARSPLLADVASALGQLGWRPAEVEKAMAALAVGQDAGFEDLVRQALRHLANHAVSHVGSPSGSHTGAK